MDETSHPTCRPGCARALGQRVYALERKLAGEALAQVFGWQLLQIGLWGDDDGLIAEGRTQRKAVLAWHGSRPGGRPAAIRSRTDSLAIASDSVDAVVLPHTLEYEPEPHEILREVGRILSAEGHLIVFGFRPLSSWGLRHLFARDGFPPGLERMIGEGRLRDWLKLLGFEIVDARRYLFTLAAGLERAVVAELLRAQRPVSVADVRRRLPDQGAQARLHADADPAALAAAAESRRRLDRADDAHVRG